LLEALVKWRFRVPFPPNLFEQGRKQLEQWSKCSPPRSVELGSCAIAASPGFSENALDQKALSETTSAFDRNNLALSTPSELGGPQLS
jgi:hypothetical protein